MCIDLQSVTWRFKCDRIDFTPLICHLRCSTFILFSSNIWRNHSILSISIHQLQPSFQNLWNFSTPPTWHFSSFYADMYKYIHRLTLILFFLTFGWSGLNMAPNRIQLRTRPAVISMAPSHLNLSINLNIRQCKMPLSL